MLEKNIIKNVFILGVVVVFASCKSSNVITGQTRSGYTQYVNPFIGTAPLTDPKILGYTLPPTWRSWAGLVYPGSSLPNAMGQLSSITKYGLGAGYEYEDTLIYGFTHTNKRHWNLCNIPVLPYSGVTDTSKKFQSRFSHKNESASPALYKVFLEDYNVEVSLTSTLRCGYHKYDYKGTNPKHILFDLAKAKGRVVGWNIEKIGNSNLEGYQDFRENKIYFYASLNTDIESFEKTGENINVGRAIIHLKNDGKKSVELIIDLPFVSIQNAKENLEKEIGNKSFDQVYAEGKNTWEQVLSAIQVKAGTEKQKQLFYSCFYRSLLWPALRSDINGEYTDVKKNVIKAEFNYYTVPSLWDTYRNKDILLSIISPRVTLDVIKSLKDMGDKTGFIPTFFRGDHAVSSITGAYLRGIDQFDVGGAYQLLLRNATIEGGTRPYITEYTQKGYISDPDIANPKVETKAKAGVSKTLEYSYNDYSLSQLAKSLGDTANYRILTARSGNYKNMFDPSTKFLRGRLATGEWVKNFDPEYPYYEYMYREANAWQVSFYAPHDMPGLIKLYGGAKEFETKLDSFFTKPWNPNHIATHVETMVGQYCQGNQPNHEAPFAYHFIGKPKKSQKILNYTLDNLYGIGEDGLEGFYFALL